MKTKDNFSSRSNGQFGSTILIKQPPVESEDKLKPLIIEKPSKKRVKARVLFEYVPAQSDELKLVVGDIIYILDKNLDDEGWWRGESVSTGRIGVFPDNFVEEINELSPLPNANNKKKPNNLSSNSGLNETMPSSLASSTTSSNNSLSKSIVGPLTIIKPSSQINKFNAYEDNFSKSQSDLSEEIEDLNNPNDINKLTHIKKAKQFNKRPPSFRNKPKNDDSIHDPAKSPDKPDSPKETISTQQVNEPIVHVKNIEDTPISQAQIHQPLTPNHSTSMTPLPNPNLSNSLNNSNQNLFDEINLLKEEIENVKMSSSKIQTDYQRVQGDIVDMKKSHDEQMRKMQRIVNELINEIDEEKKTRLALQVELERIKKNLMNY